MSRRVVDDAYQLPRPKDGTVAQRIVVAMKHAGIGSATALATRCHQYQESRKIPAGERIRIERQTIHNWLANSSDNITPRLLFLVADALGVAARWLATDKGPMTPPRALTPDDEMVLELASNLEKLGDGSKDLWIADGNGRLKTGRARASNTLPYPHAAR